MVVVLIGMGPRAAMHLSSSQQLPTGLSRSDWCTAHGFVCVAASEPQTAKVGAVVTGKHFEMTLRISEVPIRDPGDSVTGCDF